MYLFEDCFDIPTGFKRFKKSRKVSGLIPQQDLIFRIKHGIGGEGWDIPLAIPLS